MRASMGGVHGWDERARPAAALGDQESRRSQADEGHWMHLGGRARLPYVLLIMRRRAGGVCPVR